jgi:hypothetical protein
MAGVVDSWEWRSDGADGPLSVRTDETKRMGDAPATRQTRALIERHVAVIRHDRQET